MAHNIKINGHQIDASNSPYVIAEISGNHNGDIQKALKLLHAAKEAGAHAVKLQTYTPDTMTIDCDHTDFTIEGGLWHGKSLYQLYEWAHTPWEWHQTLFAEAKKLDITIFSSPFDETAVDFLESLNAPAYKVASFELVDIPLIKKVARTQKPMIMSTGMATKDEIELALATARAEGNNQIILLHCISGYPTPVSGSNINSMLQLQADFDAMVGLSDHSLGHTAACVATALGARVIEKHITLARAEGGPDAEFSLEPEEFKLLCQQVKDAHSALGEGNYAIKDAESENLKFRRSIYVVKDIKQGDVFDESNIKRIRPGYGLAPKYYEDILGKKALTDIKRGEPIKFSHYK